MGDCCGPDRHDSGSMMNVHFTADTADMSYEHPKHWPVTGMAGPGAVWEATLAKKHEEHIASDPVIGTPALDEMIAELAREVAVLGTAHTPGGENMLPDVCPEDCWSIEPMTSVNGTPLGAIENTPWWHKGILARSEGAESKIVWGDTPNGRQFVAFGIDLEENHKPIILYRKKFDTLNVENLEKLGFRFRKLNRFVWVDEMMGCAVRFHEPESMKISSITFGMPGYEYFSEQAS